MQRHVSGVLFAAAAAALAGPGLAQEGADAGAGSDQQQATGQNGGGEASGGGQSDELLSMGQEESGSTYTKETYGAWKLRCARNPDGEDPCQLYQLISDDKGNSVAEMSVFDVGEKSQAAAGATIVTPLQTLLTEQIAISVDGGPAKRYPFTWCSQVGCFARVGFTQDDVNAFRRGANATLTIVPIAAPDQEVDLSVSLNGFTNGFEALGQESGGSAGQ